MVLLPTPSVHRVKFWYKGQDRKDSNRHQLIICAHLCACSREEDNRVVDGAGMDG